MANASEPGEGERAGCAAGNFSLRPTLTRFASLTTLSRHAGEGNYSRPKVQPGFAIISQKIAITAPKAGKPKANHQRNSRK